MKKGLYFIASILGLFLFSQQTFASNSLEHFKSKDGSHFCSYFNKNEFKLCSEFGIKYNGDTVLVGKKPFFTTDGIATIDGKTFCIKKGIEESDISKCDQTIFKSNNEGNFECIIKNGIETCTQQGNSNGNVTNTNIVNNNSDNTQIKSGGTTSHSNCQVNGKEVDCAQMTDEVVSGITGILKYSAILGVLGLLGTIFYIWMLVDAITKPIPNKIIWILVIFFLSPIGAIVYYFVIKRNFSNGATLENMSPQTIPSTMNGDSTHNEGPVITNAPVQTDLKVETCSQAISSENNNTPTTI